MTEASAGCGQLLRLPDAVLAHIWDVCDPSSRENLYRTSRIFRDCAGISASLVCVIHCTTKPSTKLTTCSAHLAPSCLRRARFVQDKHSVASTSIDRFFKSNPAESLLSTCSCLKRDLTARGQLHSVSSVELREWDLAVAPPEQLSYLILDLFPNLHTLDLRSCVITEQLIRQLNAKATHRPARAQAQPLVVRVPPSFSAPKLSASTGSEACGDTITCSLSRVVLQQDVVMKVPGLRSRPWWATED